MYLQAKTSEELCSGGSAGGEIERNHVQPPQASHGSKNQIQLAGAGP